MAANTINERAFVTTMESNMRPSVLCIDSSPGMLLVCQALLEANGYIVLTACNARAGIELLKQNPVSVLVMDREIDGLSASTLAREARNINKDLPIVIFSSSPHPEGDDHKIGFFLDKAQGPRALLKTIEKIPIP